MNVRANLRFKYYKNSKQIEKRVQFASTFSLALEISIFMGFSRSIQPEQQKNTEEQ